MNLSDFLAGIPVNAVLRERISTLLEDKQRLEEKIEELESEKADLVRENRQLRGSQTSYPPPSDTIEHRGVVFKDVSKGPTGVSMECARCGVPLSHPPPSTPGAPMCCPQCGTITWFNQYGLDLVLSELPK